MAQKKPPSPKAARRHPSPEAALSEPKFTGVPPQGPRPSPGIARHFSQEHDRAAEAGFLGGKPGVAAVGTKPGQKG
jgi:hypothetical protein